MNTYRGGGMMHYGCERRRQRTGGIASICCLVLVLMGVPARGQEVIPAAQTPAVGKSEVTRNEVLQRTITLQLDRVTLKEALRAVGEQSGVVISYSSRDVPVALRVSLVAGQMAVGDALAILLKGTHIEPVVLASNLIALRVADSREVMLNGVASQQGTATISGYIRDSATGASIPQVTIRLDGTTLVTKSNSDGQYQIVGVAAGEYRVTARRVGYLAKTQTLTLNDGETKHLDFGLNPPATQLNEVVTTALGEQRRYQVGNVISTINVDSIAPNAPVTSVTDLISGRAPGVEVMESSGLVGSGEDIRIRGQSSMLLQSDPIIIIDGIRVDNTPGGIKPVLGGGPNVSPSRINDLDFSQIETISILKGPTATTEYGTDAANGVIVITTKRGVSGRPQWNASATYAASTIPSDFANQYWNWGHISGGTNTAMVSNGTGFDCTLVSDGGAWALTSGRCVVDSVTAFNPENHANTTEFGTAHSTKYDLDVGGGTDAMRYSFAGGVSDALGATHLPTVFLSQATALGYPESALDPNSETQGSVRANMSVHVAATTDVNVNVAYMSTNQESPGGGTLGMGAVSGVGLGGNFPVVNLADYGYGYGAPILGGTPLTYLGENSSQQTSRWTGGASVDWRPTPWFTTHLVTGLDHEAQTFQDQVLPVAILVFVPSDTAGGQIENQQQATNTYTVDLRGSATATLFGRFRLETSFGAQFVDIEAQGLDGYVNGLSGNAFSLDGGGGIPQLQQSLQQEKTAGAYIEEDFGIGDRCYIPLALRLDAASGFGASVAGGGASYPKYGVSCLVLNGATTLRVRGSFGAAGQQPPYGAALQQYSSVPLGSGNGPTSPVVDYSEPGNLTLQPERSQEYEGGFDLGLWGNRVQGTASAYTKMTQHALYTIGLGFDLQGSYTENIGDVRNEGFEGSLAVVIVQRSFMTWMVGVNTSVNHNDLVRLAPGILTTDAGGLQRFAQGYPLYSYFNNDFSYVDQNRDGILEADEAQFADSVSYQGVALPMSESSFATSIGLWRNAVSINGLFDYRTGFKVYNTDASNTDRGANDPQAPLWSQAHAVFIMNGYSGIQSLFGGTYMRFRELSLAYALPRRWLHASRLGNVSIVAAVRNLALWTKYPYGDPEVSNGATASVNTAAGTASLNNDIRSTSSTVVPLPRQLDLRLNVGW